MQTIGSSRSSTVKDDWIVFTGRKKGKEPKSRNVDCGISDVNGK